MKHLFYAYFMTTKELNLWVQYIPISRCLRMHTFLCPILSSCLPSFKMQRLSASLGPSTAQREPGLLHEPEVTELLPSSILQGATATNALYTLLYSRNSPVLHLVCDRHKEIWVWLGCLLSSQAGGGERKWPGSLQVDHSVIYDYIT